MVEELGQGDRPELELLFDLGPLTADLGGLGQCGLALFGRECRRLRHGRDDSASAGPGHASRSGPGDREARARPDGTGRRRPGATRRRRDAQYWIRAGRGSERRSGRGRPPHRRRPRRARRGHQRQPGLWLPRRRARRHAVHGRRLCGPRGHHRGPRLVPRPGGVRPTGIDHPAGRARPDIVDQWTALDRAGRSGRGRRGVRQAPRCPLPPDGRGPGGGHRGGRRHGPGGRGSAGGPGRDRGRDPGGAGRAAGRTRGLPRPGVPARRAAGPPDRARGPGGGSPRGGAAGRVPGPPRGHRGRRRHVGGASRSRPCASTGTAVVPPSRPVRSGRPSRPTAIGVRSFTARAPGAPDGRRP